MGIGFKLNTWRAPLRLIESWLPQPPQTPYAQAPRAVLPPMAAFARAGWLGRRSQPAPSGVRSPLRAGAPTLAGRGHPADGVRAQPTAKSLHCVRHGTRVVISGRLSEVCAELDRLAALEQPCGSAGRA